MLLAKSLKERLSAFDGKKASKLARKPWLSVYEGYSDPFLIFMLF